MSLIGVLNRAASAPDAGLDGSADHQIPALLRRAWLVTCVLVVGLGGWAALTSISGAVVAPGTIAVDGKRKAVQHLDGGIVARVHVMDGAEVREGDLLVTLESRDLKTDIAGAASEIAARKDQLRLINEELKGLVELEEKRLVPRTRVAALQKDAARLAGDLAQTESQKSRLEAKLARVEIRAPVSGRVLNLATHTVGGVIPPNATIGEVVPSGGALVVEAQLAAKDVDQVRPGQQAQVRMTSFNQRSTPSLDGKVEQVSADLVRDEARKREYYLVRVTLTPAAMEKLGGRELVPGMPSDVLITTDERTVLSYLVKPLLDQVARTFRED